MQEQKTGLTQAEAKARQARYIKLVEQARALFSQALDQMLAPHSTEDGAIQSDAIKASLEGLMMTAGVLDGWLAGVSVPRKRRELLMRFPHAQGYDQGGGPSGEGARIGKRGKPSQRRRNGRAPK